jgi:hypothetical protein
MKNDDRVFNENIMKPGIAFTSNDNPGVMACRSIFAG